MSNDLTAADLDEIERAANEQITSPYWLTMVKRLVSAVRATRSPRKEEPAPEPWTERLEKLCKAMVETFDEEGWEWVPAMIGMIDQHLKDKGSPILTTVLRREQAAAFDAAASAVRACGDMTAEQIANMLAGFATTIHGKSVESPPSPAPEARTVHPSVAGKFSGLGICYSHLTLHCPECTRAALARGLGRCDFS